MFFFSPSQMVRLLPMKRIAPETKSHTEPKHGREPRLAEKGNIYDFQHLE